MRPRFIELLQPWLGSLTPLLVPGYAFMLVLGAILGSIMIVDRARRAGFAARDTLGVLSATYVGGLLGAAAVPFTQGIILWIEHGFSGRFTTPTGIAAYGGLVGGTVGTIIALRFRKLDVRAFLDAGAPAIGIGIFFARIGCFLAGCDYGSLTSSRLGTTFPVGSHAFQDHVAQGLIAPNTMGDAMGSLPVHPTQLYEAALGLALWAIASLVPQRLRFTSLVIGYALFRSIIEMFRGDASRGHVGSISTAQGFAIVTSIVVIALLVVKRSSTTVQSEQRDEVLS